MKKLLLHLLLPACMCFCHNSFSQTDTSYFELGRIRMQKDFTQHIIIKGSDLEHMPFARVSDALAPWLHGTLSSKHKMAFVVDGMLVNDVDAWSIHDIEEITLIQNAAVQLNGAADNYHLVLVTTRRRQEASKGITIAGSSFLANTDFLEFDDNTDSKNALYHQYHIGAWQSLGKISIGATANWLHDVEPLSKQAYTSHKTPSLDRFRFNGYMDAVLAKGHTLSLRMNVSPQTIAEESTLIHPTTREFRTSRFKGTVINPSLRLTNRITGAWTHELDLSYLSFRGPSHSEIDAEFFLPASGHARSVNRTTFKDEHFLLRDRISYTRQMGDWQIQPALSFTLRSQKQESRYSIESFGNGVPTGSASGFNKWKETVLVLTPAFNLSYRNAFGLTAGLSSRLEDDYAVNDNKIFPFASATIDVLRIGDADSRNSLKIFGSFAMAGDFYDYNFKQPDLITDYDATTMYRFGIGDIYGGSVLYSPFLDDAKFHNFQAGASFSSREDRIQISYNIDARRYRGRYIVPVPATPGGFDYVMQYPDYSFTTHRVSVLARILNSGNISWLSGINASGFQYKLKEDVTYFDWETSEFANNGKRTWTGGWVNRLRIKQFTFGADLLYQFNRQIYAGSDIETFNTLRLNNIYAAYSFKIAGKKPFEIYIASRNAVQSDEWMMPDNRRYYGAGFKLNL